MLSGMSKEEKQQLDLTTASDYVYLNQVNFKKNELFAVLLSVFPISLMEQFIVIVEMMQKSGHR